VAVSAYELEALPLPLPEATTEIEELLECRAKREAIERIVERIYSEGMS